MNRKLRVVVVGGGSSYTPELIEGIISMATTLPVNELWLTDIPSGHEKLGIIGDFANRMAEASGIDINIKTAFDRRAALDRADFVITQFRVGGHEARIRDERIPLKYGCIGQETTGPGGFMKALRTIPVILDLCRDMEKLCPDAWLINFTNPSGIITETVLSYSSIKAIGLCNCSISMQNDIAKMFNCPPGEVYCDFVGLNHLLWARKVFLRGEDVTEQVINEASPDTLKMKNIKSIGMVPISYLQYYYNPKEMYQECARKAREEGVRGEVVREMERELFSLYKNMELKTKPRQLSERGGAFYSEAACGLMNSIYNNKRDTQVVCVKNNGTNLDLPDDAVIERNSVIGKDGAEPVFLGHMPLKIRGLVQTVKAYEQLTIEAGVSGDYDTALRALALHPLVPSQNIAKKMLIELFFENKYYLPQFNQKRQSQQAASTFFAGE